MDQLFRQLRTWSLMTGAPAGKEESLPVEIGQLLIQSLDAFFAYPGKDAGKAAVIVSVQVHVVMARNKGVIEQGLTGFLHIVEDGQNDIFSCSFGFHCAFYPQESLSFFAPVAF